MNTKPDRFEDRELTKTESTEEPQQEKASTETPLRQLLHWATGDRDAEAKALADETLALRESSQTESSQTESSQTESSQKESLQTQGADADRPQSVLAAAKSAVAEAHGDSGVPNEFQDVPMKKESPKQSNPLTKWEDANSLVETPAVEGPITPKIDADVARPHDVEDKIDGNGKP
jgi:hypothetical protein